MVDLAFLKSGKKKVHPLGGGGGGGGREDTKKEPPRVTIRSAVAGLIHSKRPLKDGEESQRGEEEEDHQDESSDTDMSELGEEERAFFEDLKGVDLRRRSALSRLLSLIARKMMAPSHLRRGAGCGISTTRPSPAARKAAPCRGEERFTKRRCSWADVPGEVSFQNLGFPIWRRRR
ncbi:unnamed protein product [Spirodela intermedia]|uniref:Uncharacterized protein n=1 Tax=Spirodela intermedia TaxID=51605 RepID=A0A7I8JH95_SPIIN|nr:unnamed protein product [Spirodela intermedia]CAA6669125.1 unnamed protein product [Spirodela intermedia]